MSDAELVRRILGGEIELFEKLYYRYEKSVFACLFGISHDPELARELAMDAWAAVYEKLPGFDPTRSFRCWVVGFARKLGFYTRRGKLSEREWVRLDDMLPGQEPSCPGPVEEHEHRLRDARLYRELDRLCDDQRVAVVAHCRDGESFRSISLWTNRKLKTVSSDSYRGLSVLRRAYGVDEGKLKERRRNRKHERTVRPIRARRRGNGGNGRVHQGAAGGPGAGSGEVPGAVPGVRRYVAPGAGGRGDIPA